MVRPQMQLRVIATSGCWTGFVSDLVLFISFVKAFVVILSFHYCYADRLATR